MKYRAINPSTLLNVQKMPTFLIQQIIPVLLTLSKVIPSASTMTLPKIYAYDVIRSMISKMELVKKKKEFSSAS